MAAAAVAAFASCSQVSDVTKITGTVKLDGVEEVSVIVPGMDIDTLVPVSDSKFYIEIPANVTELGSISAAGAGVQFVPDGTSLSVLLSLEEESVVNSGKPSKSVQARLNEYIGKDREIQEEFRGKYEAIVSDAALSDEEKGSRIDSIYNETIDNIKVYYKEVLAKNTDNILGLYNIQNLAQFSEDEEVSDLIGTLSGDLQAKEPVKRLKASIETRVATAEGKMFKDFTVEQPDGKQVKLSDYVGKGKYVLVDFWASWCGPCKAEIPNIKHVYNTYHKKGLDVLSVAVWDDPAASVDTAKAYGINWDQIINAQRIPTDIYGIQGIPHIILFGPDGTILKRGLREAAIEEEILKYID